MGFLIKYRRFFSCAVREESSIQALQNLRFFPSNECRRRLEAYNLAFRPRPSGFEVFFLETPLIEITSRVRFSFWFTISGSGFLKRYGLTDDDESNSVANQPGLYFDNLDSSQGPDPTPPIITDAEALLAAKGSHATAADTYHINLPIFNVFDKKGVVPSKYKLIYQLNDSLEKTFQVHQDADRDYIMTTINSPDEDGNYLDQPGPYRLKADSGSPPDRRVYLDEELGRKSVHGIVDIYWEKSQKSVPDSNGQTYNIIFKL